MKMEKIKLELKESLQEDIDKGIARIPSRVMNSLGLISGEVIEVGAKNTAIVKAMRSIKEDSKFEIIRLDGTTRSNIGSSIGGKIFFSRV